MSTRINITVDSDILLERNRQQVDVNRLKFLTDAAREDAAQEGVDRRNQDLIAAGIDPETRRPLDTSAIDPRPNFEEPGAYRRGLGVLLAPSRGYFDYGGTLTGLQGKARGVGKNPIFSRLNFQTRNSTSDFVQQFGLRFPELDFLEGEGPSSSNALQVAEEFPFPESQFLDWSEGDLYVDQIKAIYDSGLVYAITEPYDTVDEWQYSFTAPDLRPPNRLLDLDGQVVEAIPKPGLKVGDIPRSTHEFYVRHSHTEYDNYSYYVGGNIAIQRPDGFLSEAHTSSVTLQVDGLNISSRLVQQAEAQPGSLLGTFVNPMGVTLFRRGRLFVTRDPVYGVGLGSGVGSPVTESTYSGLPLSLTGQEWVHIAVTRRLIDGETGTHNIDLFVDGKRVATGIKTNQLWNETFAKQPISARIVLRYLAGNNPGGPHFPAIHGYRFTPKVLYTGDSFVPPRAITRLA